jgi:hypothetical protein
MDSETQVIRQQMEGTRTALSEKIEQLETQVTEKVAQATTSVTDTVENVSETVEETVETFKHTFDLKWQAENHPWMVVGGAILLGFLGGRLLARPRPQRIQWVPPPSPPPPPAPPPRAPENKPQESPGGWLGQFGDLKKLGIGMAMGVLREVVTRAVPTPVGPPLSSIVDNMTVKLGGEPLGTSQPDHAATSGPVSQGPFSPCEPGD